MNIPDHEIKQYSLEQISAKYGVDKSVINKLITYEKRMSYDEYRSRLFKPININSVNSTNGSPNKNTKRAIERFVTHSINECKIYFIGDYTTEEKKQKAKEILDKQEKEVEIIKQLLHDKLKFIEYIKERV